MPDWNLAETNYGVVKDRQYEVAVLPMGATEPHNLHLPYGTDTFEVTAIAERSSATASKAGANVLLLPAIPYGTETNLREFPFALNLLPSTLTAVIGDLVASLEQSGMRKLLLLNGHGGNDFKPTLRELHGRTSVHIFLCDWFRGLTADVQPDIFDDAGDHAGEMETSLMLAYHGDLVADGADAGRTNATRFEAVNCGWVGLTRPWHLLTTNSGAGDPSPASAGKGRRLMDVMVERLAAFLVELSAADIDERFPY